MAAEVTSDNARPRLVAELAAELRLSRQAVAKYVAALPTDETPVKSARHQRAAQALWGVRGVASGCPGAFIQLNSPAYGKPSPPSKRS